MRLVVLFTYTYIWDGGSDSVVVPLGALLIDSSSDPLPKVVGVSKLWSFEHLRGEKGVLICSQLMNAI